MAGEGGKPKLRSLIAEEVAAWSDGFKRGLRAFGLADPDIVAERPTATSPVTALWNRFSQTTTSGRSWSTARTVRSTDHENSVGAGPG
jgi:hypothetical protein